MKWNDDIKTSSGERKKLDLWKCNGWMKDIKSKRCHESNDTYHTYIKYKFSFLPCRYASFEYPAVCFQIGSFFASCSLVFQNNYTKRIWLLFLLLNRIYFPLLRFSFNVFLCLHHHCWMRRARYETTWIIISLKCAKYLKYKRYTVVFRNKFCIFNVALWLKCHGNHTILQRHWLFCWWF